MPGQIIRTAEWLEADGLGGFASGTVSGIRSRRYHALLLTAATPSTGRMVLVNGLEAWVHGAAGSFALSSQRYLPGVNYPDGSQRIESFDDDPWPRWVFRLADGTRIRQELFVPHGTSAVVLSWRLLNTAGALDLAVRPLMSGRDYHHLHHENPAFRFGAALDSGHIRWKPYPDVPGVVAWSNAEYRHEPEWYRQFLYDEERRRGLDDSEDLASPGTLHWNLTAGEALCILACEGHDPSVLPGTTSIQDCVAKLRDVEQLRRTAFASRMQRSADSYVVRRGAGRTVIAGYPWFTDWGRDTFISMRGLCLATGRLAEAGQILRQWSTLVSQGMLPNRFPDGGESPEFNAVDASLWFIVAVHEYRERAKTLGSAIPAAEQRQLAEAVEAILAGYSAGTRYGIRQDQDGLLMAGERGDSLTWMDARFNNRAVTPRVGKPVEVQALWLNALAIAGRRSKRWQGEFERGKKTFVERFWNVEKECLFDVIDAEGNSGAVDRAFRPNQIFAVGGLPLVLLDATCALQVVDAVERRLWTPLGLRSLAPGEAGYAPRYEGDLEHRDSTYHQGTVWPWLAGPFIEAWVRVHGGDQAAKREARHRFFDPLLKHLGQPGLGHLTEIADAEPPHTPAGCPFQAWSLGEAIRLDLLVLA